MGQGGQVLRCEAGVTSRRSTAAPRFRTFQARPKDLQVAAALAKLNLAEVACPLVTGSLARHKKSQSRVSMMKLIPLMELLSRSAGDRSTPFSILEAQSCRQ